MTATDVRYGRRGGRWADDDTRHPRSPIPVLAKCWCTWWLLVPAHVGDDCASCRTPMAKPADTSQAPARLRDALVRARHRAREAA